MYKLFKIFERFGAIRKIEREYNTQPNDRTIVFEHSDSTKRLSRQAKLAVGHGNELSIKWLKYRFSHDYDKVQPMADELVTAPGQEAPDNILNILPDDCLRTIFEASTLNIMDLTEIANVCRRFNGIATTTFKTKYVAYDFEEFSDFPLWQQDRYFRTFGPLITSIDGAVDDISCEMISAFCPAINVLWKHGTVPTKRAK